ncbi:MAG: hypothetical protein O2U62_00560 [Candidatus Bathyarchaeota archaeon]|nr:hypothetical protein [Candidatus Bathyarchaeota archaeon]
MSQQKPLVRTTAIEAFRRYLANGDNDYYEITEQSVIDSVTGKFKGNEQTRIGTAFHGIVQHGEQFGLPIENGYEFSIDGHSVGLSHEQRKIALDYRDEHPHAYHEFRGYKDYGRAIVTGCADMIDGVEIRDIKTKYSAPSDSEYINSCQWRYYLDIFGADVFHFDLFVFHGYDKEKHGYDVRPLELTRHTPPITCYRYPEMENDNLILLNQFMDWAEARGLTEYLTSKRIN